MNNVFLRAGLCSTVAFLISFSAFSMNVGFGVDREVVLEDEGLIYKQAVIDEEYEDTCTKRVQNPTREVCTESFEGKVCHTEDPSYSYEPYLCTKHRKHTGDVLDHRVYAKIKISKDESAKGLNTNCLLSAKINDNDETYFSVCKTAIVRAKVVSRKDVLDEGHNKNRDVSLVLSFAPIENLSALKGGLTNLAYKDGIVSFSSADLSAASNFKLSVTLTKKRFLRKDKVVFEQELEASDYQVEAVDAQRGFYKTSFDLKKLSGVDSSSGSYILKLVMKTIKPVDVQGAINVPALANELSQSLVIKE
jgi:hypothetical protein